MSKNLNYIRSELISLGLLLAAACLLSYGGWKRRRWFKWLPNFGDSIDNIYQLIPILQKNARALFLVFNDLANAINSVPGSHGEGNRLTKETARLMLSQDWVQAKLIEAQDAVLQELNITPEALQDAISRFHNEIDKSLKPEKQDDQVRMYTDGVELMYNIVLDGGYPHCPGVGICEAVTKQVALSIIEKVIEAKKRHLAVMNLDSIEADTIEQDVVHSEMQRFGYSSRIHAYIAFKNTENAYQYDVDFTQARHQLYMNAVKQQRFAGMDSELKSSRKQ